MERLSTVIEKQPLHPRMQRKYRRRMWITVAVQLAISAIVLSRMIRTIPPRDESQAQNVYELLEAIRPQIVQPEAEQ